MEVQLITKDEIEKLFDEKFNSVLELLTNNKNAEPSFLTVKQTAEKFQIGETLLWSMRKNNRIPYYKINKKILFRSDEVLQALEKYRIDITTN